MLFFFFHLFLHLESPPKRLYHAFGHILYMNTNKIKICYWGMLRSDGTAFGYLHVTLFYYFLILLMIII